MHPDPSLLPSWHVTIKYNTDKGQSDSPTQLGNKFHGSGIICVHVICNVKILGFIRIITFFWEGGGHLLEAILEMAVHFLVNIAENLVLSS